MKCHFCAQPITTGLEHHHLVPLADGGPAAGQQVVCHASCHNHHHRENGDYARWTHAQYADRVAIGPEETRRILASWGRKGYRVATAGDKRAWHRAGGLARVANGRDERGRFISISTTETR